MVHNLQLFLAFQAFFMKLSLDFMQIHHFVKNFTQKHWLD